MDAVQRLGTREDTALLEHEKLKIDYDHFDVSRAQAYRNHIESPEASSDYDTLQAAYMHLIDSQRDKHTSEIKTHLDETLKLVRQKNASLPPEKSKPIVSLDELLTNLKAYELNLLNKTPDPQELTKKLKLMKFNQRQLDKTNLQEPQKSEAEQAFTRTIQLIESKLLPQTRTEALTQKKDEIIKSNIGVRGASRGWGLFHNISQYALHAAVHIPFVGSFLAFFVKNKVDAEIADRKTYQKTIGDACDSYIGKHPLEQDVPPSPLRQALFYSFFRQADRLKKLELRSELLGYQTAGVIPIIGTAIATFASVARLLQNLGSIGTFFWKLATNTLGKERNQHASILYGLALECLDAVHEPAQDSKVALNLLQKLNIAPQKGDKEGLEEFKRSGFAKIRNLLRS